MHNLIILIIYNDGDTYFNYINKKKNNDDNKFLSICIMYRVDIFFYYHIYIVYDQIIK